MMEDFDYNHDEHLYRLGGMVIPSITQTLKLMGFVDKRYFSEATATRGTHVHLACQFLVEKNLNWESVDESIRPRVETFGRFLEEMRPELIFAEIPLHHSLYRFGGTPDLFVKMNGELCVIDIKSGKAKLAAKLQTAAQKLLIEQMRNYQHGQIKRFALELPEKGNYKLVPHDDRKDAPMFLNAVSMVYRRVNEGELNLEKELKNGRNIEAENNGNA